MAKVSPDATPQTTSSSKSGLTKRQRAHKVLREDTADHLDPISRTVFEKGRVVSGFADLESVGLIYPEENLNRALLYEPWVFTKSAFTSRLGYSNVCIALDTKPAKYISSVLLQFFSYFCLEYSRTDILRSNAIWEHNRAHGLPNIRWRYYLNVGANVVFAMSSVIFTGIVLMFAPHHGTEQDDHGHDKADNSGDLWVHTMTFIQWIWANAFLLLVNHLDAEFQTRTQKIVFWTYIFFCIVSPLEVIVNYAWFDKEGTYLTPWWLNMFLDHGWLLLHGSIVAAGVPMSTALVRNPKEPRIFYLDPEHFAMKQKEDEDELSASPAGTSILHVLFFPFVLCSLVFSLLVGAAKHIGAKFGVGKPPNPLAKAHKTLKVDAETGVQPGTLKYIHAWVGNNIFGMINVAFAPGAKKGHICNRWEHGSAVYAGNVGTPVVFLMDVDSSIHAFENVDNRKPGHHYDVPALRWRGDQEIAKPNFLRSGPQAVKVRDFNRAILPKDATGERWESAMNMVKKRIASWAEHEVEELPHFDIKGELQCGLLQLFVSHLFFGESLDISFVMNHVYPGPQLTFWYPYFPNWLNPAYHKLKRSKKSLYDFMRECPRAGENRAAYEAAGLTEIEAFEAMLTMLTFNASGAGNSGLNLLYCLPHFEGKEQMKDDDELLTSFCCELLRNNGPPAMFKMGFKDGSKNNDDYTTVHTSKKEAFAIKNGTTCCFNCAVLGRDETRWEDPDTFRADRFVPLAPATQAQRDSTTGTEPLPVLALGCPLGKSKDEEYVKNAHCCVFTDLIVPFLKGVTRTLLDHEHKLDHHSNAVLGKLVVKGEVTQLTGGSRRSKCPFAFNIKPENMNQTADLTEDQTPPVGPRVRVQYFHRAATG